jgi:hypothetical protein
MKPLAKSLHTVTVLVAIANTRKHDLALTFERVDYALRVLGLENAPDVYGLREQAIAKLNKGN